MMNHQDWHPKRKSILITFVFLVCVAIIGIALFTNTFVVPSQPALMKTMTLNGIAVTYDINQLSERDIRNVFNQTLLPTYEDKLSAVTVGRTQITLTLKDRSVLTIDRLP